MKDGRDLRFSVLGPLRATHADEPIAISAGKQRVVLATLLLNAGQEISYDELSHRVWYADAPVNARSALYTYVTRLRRVLGDSDEPTLIRTHAQGYVIDVEQDRLDLARFRRLVRHAGQAAGEGDLAGEAELLGQALELWREPVLANVPSEVVHRDDVPRLAEERVRTLERWFEVSLRLGRHDHVVGDLLVAAGAYPLREGLQAQLMLALYRSGRQAEALKAYHGTAMLLRRELGVDPGKELRTLQHAILHDDPELAASPPAETRLTTGPQPPPVPGELPADVAGFVGRATEVERLTELTTRGKRRMAAITGAGGIGKSALALHVAHRVAADFPDGQLYVDLLGSTLGVEPLPPREVLARFLRSLGVTDSAIPSSVEEAAGRFRSLCGGKRVLIVLDNAHSAAQVRPLLPGSATCAVLLTSRRTLGSLTEFGHHELGALPEEEATALLTGLVGADRVGAERAACAEIVRVCAGMPLALQIVAARLHTRASWPIQVIADRLGGEQRRLTELRADDRAVRTSLQVSYEDLRAGASARMFRLLGLLESPDTSVPVAAALAGLPEPEAERILDRLADERLLQTATPGRYRLHDLVRLFARERVTDEEPEDARTRAVQRALHCQLATARTALRLIHPHLQWPAALSPRELVHPGIALNDRRDAREWIRAENGNFVATVRQAMDAPGDGPSLAVALGTAMATFMDYLGLWQAQRELAGLAVTAADRTGDLLNRATAHSKLGWSMIQLGESLDSIPHLQTALAALRELGNDRGEAAQLTNLATAFRHLRRMEEAIDHYRQALAIYDRLGIGLAQGVCLTNLGLVYQRIDRPRDAIETHERAVAILESLEEDETLVSAMGNLAEAYRLGGDTRQAIACFRRVLAIDHQVGSGSYPEAEHLWGLGRALYDAGEHEAAREHWRRSAAVLYDLGHLTAQERLAIESSANPPTPAVIDEQL
ncbi:DNA-binding transcriptional activator of the SARP family [Nonomuraea solani]|uniref:DNA-binding transcriptional activator of the SARP family n=1 Tax=Nonomuraea solani TaxID=1144553 RepID=A0A1H6EXX3_9ACTN|nr:BTAD domain-containing putative transcriptional regulator [Nonomuraea solani]SEH01795.1 DNA-binding transcriptional activator of the SARP family [Nonomuraea solani]